MSRNKLRLCFFVYGFPPDFSGATLQTIELANVFRRLGIDLFFLTYTYHKKFLNINKINGFRVVRFLRKYTLSLSNYHINLLKALIKQRNKFNVLYINGNDGQFWTPMLLCTFCLILKKKVFMELNMEHYNSDPLGIKNTKFEVIKIRVAKMMNQYISNSTAISKSFDVKKIGANKLSQIYYGIDINKFKKISLKNDNLMIKKRLGLPENKKVVIMCGRVSKRKGIDFLIDMWERVISEYKEAVLVVVGNYGFFEQYDEKFIVNIFKKVQSEKLKGTIILTGEVDNVQEYMQVSDILAFTSRQEGSPSTIREAMASSLPVVTLHLKDITTDIISHMVDGIIVKVNDREEFIDWQKRRISDEHVIEEFSNWIIRLLKDDALAKQLGDNARITIEKRFTIEVKAQKYLEMFNKF